MVTRQRIRPTRLFFSILGGMGMAFFSSQAQAETGFLRAIEAAMEHSPTLRGQRATMEWAEIREREVAWERFPSLSARSQFTRSDQPVYVFGTLMQQGRFGPNDFGVDTLNRPSDLNNLQSAIDLSFPLFTGYRRTTLSHIRSLEHRQAAVQNDFQIQSLRLRTALLYHQLLGIRDSLAVLEERIAESERDIADAKALKDRGVVLSSDFYAAEGIRAGLKVQRERMRSEQSGIQAELALLTGHDGWMPLERLSTSTVINVDFEDLQQAALRNHPDVRWSGLQTTLAQENQSQSRRSFWPQVQAFASWETNTRDFESNPTHHTLGVAAQMPFGDPAYRARQQGARAAQTVAEQSQAETIQRVKTRLSNAYAGYRAAESSLPWAREMWQHASRSLELVRPLYHAGRQSVLEVLRAEEALARAHTAYLQAQYEREARYLELQAAAGLLNDDTLRAAEGRLR